jgi:16S rRNA (guanine966-N2)-methyltransferase
LKKVKANTSRKSGGGQSNNQLRIIGGQWRGRKLNFADGEGLRPTMDRVRETLFNWLQNDIVGARCLDLFSGSGALGLEALSRYAGEVVMIDKNPQAIAMIKKNLQLLGVENAQVVQGDAKSYLLRTAESSLQTTAEGSSPTKSEAFDIVFLDPPFNKQLVAPFCDLLARLNCLSEQASIYIEMEKNTALPDLPQGWQVRREKKAGQLAYYLVEVENHL